MNRAAGAVAAQVGEAEALGDDALAGERRVAVDQQRQHRGALDVIVVLLLLGADLSQHHRIDDFEMRGIGGQRQMHAIAVELAIRRGAEVIFYVAGAFDFVGSPRPALELVKDRPVRLAHDLGQHVEPAAVCHAEHDLLDAERAAALDDLLQRRHHRLRPVDAEPLGTGVFDVDEFLEAFRLDQFVEDGALAFAGERDLLVGPFDALLDPGLLRRVGDVHEFDAERLAIGPLQDGDDLAQGGEFQPQHVIDEDLAVVIGLGEAVRARVELFGVFRRLKPERVEVGVIMPADAIGADQHQRPNGIAGGALDLRLGKLRAGGLRSCLDLARERLVGLEPMAVERRDQFVARRNRPVRTLPGRTLGAF